MFSHTGKVDPRTEEPLSLRIHLEGLRPADFWDVTVSNVLYTWELLGRRALRVVADAYFANARFIKPLMEKGIAVVVHDVWLRNIPKKVRVVVIEGIKEPFILVCTDLSLTAAQIIEIYAARFALEITIRDFKQHFGFTDYQSTTSISIFRFVQLCCTTFCIWKLMLLSETASTWLEDVKPKAKKESALSFARARRGLRQFVIKQIFLNSALTPDFKKIEDEYEPIFRIVA